VSSSLSGPLLALSLPALVYMSLNNNDFIGALPLWIAPQLVHLNLASTPFNGALPPGWWERMPRLEQFDASSCALVGPIPDAAVPHGFTNFHLNDNQLTGSLPTNISAIFYSVANNRLSGPVDIPDGSGPAPVRYVFLAHNDFSCPIRLSHLSSLQQLHLQGGGFAGCDFNDPTQMQLPASLTSIDVSLMCSTSAAHFIAHARAASEPLLTFL